MTAGRTSKDRVSPGHDIPNRMTWEPWEGSQTLPRWSAASEARRLPARLGGRVWSGCAIDKGDEREGRADRA
jgi:hypothetical protein